MSKKNKKKNRSSAAKKQNTAVNNKKQQTSALPVAAEETKEAKTQINPAEEETKEAAAQTAPEKTAEKAVSTGKEKAVEKQHTGKSSAKHNDHTDNSHILKPAVSYAYIIILFILLIIVFLLKLKGDRDLAAANERNEQLSAAILTASDNIAQLTAENAEQKKQLDAMSTAINARTELNETQKKEEEESALPILYPVKGIATVITDIADGEDTDVNLMRFSMEDGASVLATGSGLVEVLSDDGDGFVNITIDHGNGYKSRYVGEGTALCEAGKEVKRGDLIMLFTENDSRFTYSILQNGKTVDPMSVMVIDG